jgi:hypothetical protein
MKTTVSLRNFVAVFAALVASCSPTTYKEVYPTLIDGRYDSEFPYRSCSQQLETIGQSVVLLSSLAYYRSYSFGFDEKLTTATIGEAAIKGRKSTVELSQIAGTATVIASDERRVVLLTCAHVVDFPDTTTSFYQGPDRNPTGFVQSRSYLERQINYVAVFPEGGEMSILAIDRAADLALVGCKFEQQHFPSPRVIGYPAGRAKDLEWGSFVYLFGYPGGYKMVTKGIVSSPNRDKRGSFLVDAVLDRGFSGGIVLAIKDGVPNFELVGIIKMLPGRSISYLAPATGEGIPEYDPGVPYKGDIFVQRRLEITNGICQAISIEAIAEFVDRNRDELSAKGYSISFPVHPEPAQ